MLSTNFKYDNNGSKILNAFIGNSNDNSGDLYSSPESFIRQMSNENTASTFEFNASEAQKARDFSEYMSNTSHQREVEDLKRAGLNPVLSANGGASAYSASSASASADSSAVGALASVYLNKMNNDNAVKIAEMSNKNNLEIAKINASASKYASDKASSASKYASDNSYSSSIYGVNNSKYGMINNLIEGLLDGKSNGSAVSNFGSFYNKALRYVFNKKK